MNKTIIGSITAGVVALAVGTYAEYKDTVFTCKEILANPGVLSGYGEVDLIVANCQSSCPERTLTFAHDGSLQYESGNWEGSKPICK